MQELSDVNIILEAKECYANNGTDCTVLKVRACNPRGCSFYKTKEQQEEQVRLAQVRCARLGVEYGRAVGSKGESDVD